MKRREFLQASAAMAFSLAGGYAQEFADRKPRVGLIGCGWYGKCDLFRLIQVAPVEVVSLCDVDKQMLAGAAEMVAERQASKKKPRTYSDYRALLKEKDLDIVLIATPDHWHALPMIAAVKLARTCMFRNPSAWMSLKARPCWQRPANTSESSRLALSGAARRIWWKPATPSSGRASSERSALVEVYCYYHMRARENPPDSAPPETLDYETWTGPAPMRPYNSLVHPRRWRAFMEYGNGIMGDMCIHMLDMVRWMLGLGLAEEHFIRRRDSGSDQQQGQHCRHANRNF